MVTGTAVRERLLDVRLLGPISAERNGETVSLGGPRQRAVLARLALGAGQVVTVDRLVDDIWAGEPPTTAVNTLQSYVSLLRRALGDAQYLRRDGPGYVLTLDRELIDALRFEDLLDAARSELDSDPGRALELLDTALAEWRGPVLADVVDEEWARPAAVRWEELRWQALETRFDALLDLGRHGEAIPELERAVDEHPLREGFARRLMLALYRGGRQVDALRAFSRARQVLADELGLDPTPDLTGLQTQILNHDPALAPPASSWTPPVEVVEEARAARLVEATPAPPGPSPVALPGPAARASSAPFVGRAGQLAQLRQIWAMTSAGGSHLAFLHGEPGAGKSRLAAQFATEVHGDGAVVLWGRATAEAIVPFEPMVEAVRAVLRSISDEARRRVAAERGLLALLLPELDQLVPGTRMERPDPTVERYLLFETVAELLRTESAVHPLLVVLDDLQWADPPSLRMVEHVLRHELPGRVMVVATVRVPSDEPVPELDRMAAELARDGLMTRLSVGALGKESIVELLRLNDRDPDAAAELATATGGNAFFVTELIRHTDGAIGGELPESIRAMIGLRLDRLDPPVVQVLNLAAVAGQAATLAVLGDASGLEGDALLDAADAAVAAGLLVEDGAGRLGLPHALIGQAVRGRLGRTRRLELHRRIAMAIERADEPQSSPAILAHHLLEAGSLVDRETRVAAGVRAGQHSVLVGAHEDAAAWVDRVGALVSDRIGPRPRAELAILRCDVERARGDRAAAIDAVRDAARWARDVGDPMLLARAAEGWMMSLSGVGFDIGQPPDPGLVTLMEQAISELPEDNVRYRVRLRSMLTSVLVPDPDPDRRRQLAAEAMAIATAHGDDEVMASALLARRLASSHRDALGERTELVLESVRHARRSNNAQLELTAMLFALGDLLEQGRMTEHLALLDEFASRAADVHLTLFEVYGRFQRASHALSAGDYAEARRLADDALATGRRSHGVNAEIAYAGAWFRLALDLGRAAETLPESERMLAARPRLRMWQVAVVRALVETDRREEARAHFEDLVTLAGPRARDNQMYLPHVCALAEVSLALGDAPRAAVIQRALEPYADRIATSGLAGISTGPVSNFAGIAALAAGDLDAAERHLNRAIARNVADGTRPHEARARLAMSRVHAARGRPTEATAEEEAARDIAASIGLVLPG